MSQRALLFIGVAFTLVAVAVAEEVRAQTRFTDELLIRARSAARTVPGDLPREVRYLKFAESKMPLGELVEGAGDSLVVGAYTVFQVRYANGWIMVDAGMDRDVDTTVTSWRDRFDRVKRGLAGGDLILVTHEHHDHVAEAVRNAAPDVIAPKTLLTRAQVQTLVERPNSPLIQLTPDRARQYLVFDYETLYPVAPGLVLIKAPGHTPGSQMVCVRLASGRELLLIGDVAWMMAGVDRRLQKPRGVSDALSEDRNALKQPIDWLSGLTARQGVVLVNCHDDAWLQSLVRRGVLADELDLRAP